MLVEMCDLSDCSDVKNVYNIKIENKVSPMGQQYQEICGEYDQVVGFLSEVYDMNVVDVMVNVR